jgi:hypothetical protein
MALQLFGSSESTSFLAQVPPQALALTSPVPPGPTGSAAFKMSPVNVTFQPAPNGVAFTFSVFVTDLAGQPIQNVCIGPWLSHENTLLHSGGNSKVCTGKDGKSSFQFTATRTGSYRFTATIDGLDQTATTLVQIIPRP